MQRVLIAECMQEISSFNPLLSDYDHFAVQRGDEIMRQASLNSPVGGALAVFGVAAGIEVVPAYSARAGSAGLLAARGWQQLSRELVATVAPKLNGVDGIYVSLHGAMGAEGELDPEGWILEEIRRLAGPDIPIVISLDLHGILTDRMLRQINGLAIYHTYPHVDFADTGARAARLLLRLLAHPSRTTIARVVIPALVRGDELITKSGCYGDIIRECQRIERDGTALAAGVMIGNPFTDVPELCSQAIVMTADDPVSAEREALRLAGEFWPQRHRMQGKFISVERAIAQARSMAGPVLFTDAADATSSGASGDSNLILRALRDAGYDQRALAQIVDPGAAQAAHQAGVGATIDITLGGCHDPARFAPMRLTAKVRLLSDGQGRLETMRAGLDAGPTAVLTYGNTSVVVMSRSVSLFDRAMYYAVGIDPRDHDLIVVKSPHTEYHMYDEWVEKNFNIDVPGATSANIKTLGHTICARPMFPLDPDLQFTPAAVLYAREHRARQDRSP
ncbi:MAG TPA: M81 family metallopeptidase [Acetobacteraceae bacterium]